jgi:hypothetical protein
LLGQWTAELNHVVAIVGGATSQAKNAGQPGIVFTPVPGQRQKQAVSFLNQNAFATPAWLIDPEVLRRIEPSGALNRIRNAQTAVLNNLLDSARFLRIVEQEAIDGMSAWSPGDFLAAVRAGLWGELSLTQVRIDAYRRNLQRAYLDIAISRVSGANSDEKSLYRAELKSLAASIATAMARTPDKETKAHLDAVRAQISVALAPRTAPPPIAAAVPRQSGFAATGIPASCVPDY